MSHRSSGDLTSQQVSLFFFLSKNIRNKKALLLNLSHAYLLYSNVEIHIVTWAEYTLAYSTPYLHVVLDTESTGWKDSGYILLVDMA